MSGFRVGLGDLIVNSRYSPTALARADYLIAVASGVDSFWVGDHLNSLFPRSIATPRYLGVAKLIPKIDAALEPWTLLGHLASRNRFARLRLGVGVTDASRRNPAVTAQAAATLHLITRGRAILGIGVGEREGNEPYGVDWTKPVARFEEAVATIRALWNSGGALVSRESAYFPLRNAVFDLPPCRGSGPRSGSPRTGRACCAPPADTPTPGSRGWYCGRLTTHAGWRRCVPRRPMRGGIRCRSRQPAGYLSSPPAAATRWTTP